LLYYLTNVLVVAAAGFAVCLPKLLDVVCNPFVGRLSDSTVSRWGPRRPWMVAGDHLLNGICGKFFPAFHRGAAPWWWRS
jgi:glycoside/pentoside/hexuronide:cation symporter, GPH family